MIVREAKEIARQWVRDEGAQLPGFYGAFFHGSLNWLSEEALLPENSDVDVMVVLTEPPTHKLGKFRYRGVLLEISYLSRDDVASAEKVLGNYPLAGSFRENGIIADPSGELTALQEAVAQEYTKRSRVYQRCEAVRDKIRNGLQYLAGMDTALPFHDAVTPWLFTTGITTHVLLVAGLKNPTVRKRYVAVRELLAAYGFSDFYEPLLALMLPHGMNPERAMQHLAATTAAFDTAKAVLKTPYPFAADISGEGRPIAIDGSSEMIKQGDHREALFWITATYSRCQWVLAHDAPLAVQEEHNIGYRALLADLGITSLADLQQRGEAVGAFLPRVWETAEAIIAANPEIQ
jgi:hypothetical protein